MTSGVRRFHVRFVEDYTFGLLKFLNRSRFSFFLPELLPQDFLFSQIQIRIAGTLLFTNLQQTHFFNVLPKSQSCRVEPQLKTITKPVPFNIRCLLCRLQMQKRSSQYRNDQARAQKEASSVARHAKHRLIAVCNRNTNLTGVFPPRTSWRRVS